MSTLRIEERFTVDVPPARVFEYLTDPQRIVGCLPGASLSEVTDDGVYHGNIRVKLGAASIAYRGSMSFTEVDADAGLMRVEGAGRERTGAGGVKLVMEGRVLEVDEGSEVVVDARVKLAGKIVRFARGMLQSVSREVFRQFSECFARTIAEGRDADGESSDVEEVSATKLLGKALLRSLKK